MKTQNSDNQQIEVRGEITLKAYDQSTLKPWQRVINSFIRSMRQYFPEMMKLYQLGSLSFADEHKNVICNAGFNAVIKRLTNDLTYTGVITHMLLGDGVGSASASDTTLISEVYRNQTTSGTDSSNVGYLTAYFTETEVTGTFTEFGNVIDGDDWDGGAGADTGKLWSHLTGLNWVKNSTTVWVVSCKYTFASV